MSKEMTPNDKFDLVTRNLQEVIDAEEIKQILQQRDLKIYWGTAPTGRIHIGYLFPMLKMADLLDANCEVTILIADIHAFLDNMKSPWEKINARSEYYTIVIQEILKILQVDISKLKFVKGSSYQLTSEYTMDVYKANSFVTLREAKKAGAEVVKQSNNPCVNGLLYPTLQALDMKYLSADIFFGGIDQRKINTYARDMMPKLCYEKGSYLMNQMISGLSNKKKEQKEESKGEDYSIELKKILKKASVDNLQQTIEKLQSLQEQIESPQDKEITNKMSSSDDTSKIDLIEEPNSIKKKISKAYCLTADIVDNTPLLLTKKLLFPILRRLNKKIIIDRSEQYGGKIEYDDYEKLEQDFATKQLHPGDLKNGITTFLCELLEPIRKRFTEPAMQDLLKQAYD